MTTVLALVILTGAACSSPVEQAARETIAWQVPCAIVIREMSANPFKVTQAQNTITPPAPKAVPVYKYPAKKKAK